MAFMMLNQYMSPVSPIINLARLRVTPIMLWIVVTNFLKENQYKRGKGDKGGKWKREQGDKAKGIQLYKFNNNINYW